MQENTQNICIISENFHEFMYILQCCFYNFSINTTKAASFLPIASSYSKRVANFSCCIVVKKSLLLVVHILL